ncbi:MAG: hypothetical protein ABFE13_23895 [Phycisphaerales bacterium]
MRAVSLSGIALLLCIVLAQEQSARAEIREGDTNLSFGDENPSEEWGEFQEMQRNQADRAEATNT